MQNHLSKALVFLVGLLLGTITLVVVARIDLGSPRPISFHEHANVGVYLNGKKLDLSANKYMYVVPCFIDGEVPPGESSSNPIEKIHLHNNNGETVHVHHKGLTYADFFEGINMKLQASQFIDDQGNEYASNNTHTLDFYLNGQKITDLAGHEVRDLDKALITYGPKTRSSESINEELLSVPDDACISSGTCEHRGQAPAENCGSHETKSWVESLLGY